jgi:hypothetical protein
VTKQIRSRKEKYNFWKKHIHKWQQSNLSQVEYCRNNNLSIKTFGYRKRQITGSSKETHSFIPVTIQAEPVRSFDPESPLRLLLQNGLKIEVTGDFNPFILQKLIRTAEAVS